MLHVSLVAVPEAQMGALTGAIDILSSVGVVWPALAGDPPGQPRFKPEIVAATGDLLSCANGVSVRPHRDIREVEATDIIYVPAVILGPGDALAARNRDMIAWLRRMFERGALICSSCTGSFLLAAAGLLDGREATTHWAFAGLFRQLHPQVLLRPERILVQSGPGHRLVTAGGSSAWHDLMLYLIARHCGREAALQTAKLFLIQWHPDGQMPFACFQANLQHGDAKVRAAQLWLAQNASARQAVEMAARTSGLGPATFLRRFKKATGYTPIAYVQHLRIELAKTRLEASDDPVDDIGAEVGYDDSASFRRLFKRIVGLTPSDYRRRFRAAAFRASPAGDGAWQAATSGR